MEEILRNIDSWSLKQAYLTTLKEVLGHIDIVRRLDRAYEILTRDSRYEILVLDGGDWIVGSPNDRYIVNLAQRSCTCPDSTTLCKHRLAVRIINTALEIKNSG